MIATITIQPGETCSISVQPDGTGRLVISQDVLIRAYCDYVAAQVPRHAARSEGDHLQ